AAGPRRVSPPSTVLLASSRICRVPPFICTVLAGGRARAAAPVAVWRARVPSLSTTVGAPAVLFDSAAAVLPFCWRTRVPPPNLVSPPVPVMPPPPDVPDD